MPANEASPLLENGHSNGDRHHQIAQRLSHFFKTSDDEPTWLESYRYFFFGSYFNVLLIFIPLSFISHWLDWDASLRFSFSFIAIMPLAKLLGDATEQMSLKLGQTLAGLLNATFGNAVEIIVGIAALLQGELRIVQTSMLGSILSNLLLVLGCSFFFGGLQHNELIFQETGAQAASSLMTLACITLVIPAAYHMSKSAEEEPFNGSAHAIFQDIFRVIDDGEDNPTAPSDSSKPGLLTISRGTALILLLVYIAYLVFQLRTHAHYFKASPRKLNDEGQDANNQGSSNLPSHVQPVPRQPEEDEDSETPRMSTFSAAIGLLVVTVVTSFCADYLVASIEEVAKRYHIPKAFIGLILLPIVSNAAEHVTSVWMALKNKTELTIGICVGSSIQIATFVVPLLVIVGWITGHELTLFFADFETIVLFVSVILVNLLIMDGKSNYMEGVMLITLYVVIALAFWVS